MSRRRTQSRFSQHRALPGLAVCVLASLCLALPAAASADAPGLLTQMPEGSTAAGSGAGQMDNPRGIGTDPASGHLFIADLNNARIDVFNAWGGFVHAWGWDVSPEGAPGDTASDELELCTSLCKAGVAGDGVGQINGPFGVAVDAAGDVYVSERSSKRVQKFSPAGEFLAMFGGEVDKTSGANVCRKADVEAGDTCGAGASGTADAFFSDGGAGNNLAYDPSTDTILAGDNGRIQRFEADGAFKEKIETTGKSIESLAADAQGDLYVSYAGENDVHKLSPAGSELQVFPVSRNPFSGAISVAVDAEGNVYALAAGQEVNTNSYSVDRVLKFDANGNKLLPTAAEEEAGEKEQLEGQLFPYIQFHGLSVDVHGLATNLCPGSEAPGNLYLSFFGGEAASYVRAYGTPPSGCEPPPARAPIITAQYATAAGADAATLQAKINPLFWQDATYYVEYGTGRCSEGGCPLRAPASDALLTPRATSEALKSGKVSLTGLAPGTTYHYRFVASSGGGGPEYGVRPVGEETVEGSATAVAGGQATFRTFALPDEAEPCPANEAFRTGPSAALPDCRAYELVSPLDKGNGDAALLPKPVELNQSALSGERFTYSSLTPFADPESAPYLSQYLASRDASSWTNANLSSPHTKPPGKGFGLLFALHNEFKAFSPELCTAWLAHFSLSTLAAGAVPGYANLYRRQGCSGAPGYEAITNTTPVGRPVSLYGGGLGVVGFSADQSEVAFLADGALTADAPPLNEGIGAGGEPGLQLYVSGPGGLRFACHLPSGSPASTPCAAGFPAFSPDGDNDAKGSAVQGALSADGTRLYWTAYQGGLIVGQGSGQIYLTTNPDQPQSAHLHGSGAGTGDLIGPAACTGDTQKFSKTISNLKCSAAFVVGQPISGPGIPAGTVVTELPEAGKLRIDKEATLTAVGSTLSGPASNTVANLTTSFGAFGPEQEISGPGIPPATTIESCSPACGPGATSLTLSALPTKTTTGASLDATSQCTEADAACTIAVSESITSADAEYWGAAADGSRAIYRVTEGPLKGNVYEFDAATGGSQLIAAGGLAPMGLSQDARRLYFASSEILGDGASEGAEEGANNLYLHEAPQGGGQGSFKFIMRLVAQDFPPGYTSPLGAASPAPTLRTSNVSADGLHAAFGSGAVSPTGYSNLDAGSGEADQEVYLYDAGAGKLICASCNPSGARPAGVFNDGVWAAARLAPRRIPLHAPRALSDDGARLFFESYEALVPRDTNATWDVYQWEAAGKGSCTPTSTTYNPDTGGCVELLSSGLSPSGARFLDADPSGTNVFIGTQAGLIKADPGLNDVYDVRINGGFPEAPPPAPGCEGEACQSPPPAPEAQTPASEAFHGAGNVHEEPSTAKCPKGKVKKHGRCVKKPHRHHKGRPRRAGR